MKLSECWHGRVVQYKYCSYEEALEQLEFGHIEGFRYSKYKDRLRVIVRRPKNKQFSADIIEFYPEDLIPLED